MAPPRATSRSQGDTLRHPSVRVGVSLSVDGHPLLVSVRRRCHHRSTPPSAIQHHHHGRRRHPAACRRVGHLPLEPLDRNRPPTPSITRRRTPTLTWAPYHGIELWVTSAAAAATFLRSAKSRSRDEWEWPSSGVASFSFSCTTTTPAANAIDDALLEPTIITTSNNPPA